ncbi:MAG: gliding motility-associated C-terminal domain-containing protein [Flavobacteriales bacterium]|nr:gliding motility-associated C-terminal domain-containing protein [Flavobacteriales bacterium]
MLAITNYRYRKLLKTHLALLLTVTVNGYGQNNCQSILPLITNSSVNETVILEPITNDEITYYDLCQGETLTLKASAEFPQNNNSYSQTISSTRFLWSIDDVEKNTSQNFSHKFTDPGGYVISLQAKDAKNCESEQPTTVFVRVSTQVKINPSVSPSQVCPGVRNTIGKNDNSDITLSTNIEIEPWESPPCEDEYSNPLYLPDGNGALYSADIILSCFDENQTIMDANDIISVDLNIEHSYAGDLDIFLTAPNGTQVVLFEKTGSSIWFGEATDDDDTETNPGIGYDYGWSMNPTYNGFMSEGFENNTVTFIEEEAKTLKADSYLPVGNFNDFIGSSLNGIWTLSIKDNLKRDNGWIFSWGININKELAPPSWSFQNYIVDQYFSTQSNIDQNLQHSIVINPQEGIQNYSYEVVDNFGCNYREDFTINVNAIEVTEKSTDEYCDDGKGELKLEIQGGTPDYTIEWESGKSGKVLSNLSEGTYYYTIKDALNCIQNGSGRVKNNEMGLHFDTEIKNDHCQQGIGEITLSPQNGLKPYSYDWYDSNKNQNSIKNLSQGNYQVQITDNQGCKGELDLSILDAPDPLAYFTPDQDTVAYQNGEVQFLNQSTSGPGTSIISNEWSINDNPFSEKFNSQFDFNEMGAYTVSLKITDNYGCIDSYSKEILATENYYFWSPTAFSPNGDNINDFFNPIVDRIIEDSFQLFIYDIWGKLVFHSKQVNQGWNGKRENNDEIIQMGTYYYKVRFQSLLNKWHEKTGTLVVLK